MVLSNAQRQALYRQRLKAQAAQSGALSSAMTELLTRHRLHIAELEEQVRQMESFLCGGPGFGTHGERNRDTTAESIASTQAKLTELRTLVAKHDPDGLTE